MKQSYLVCYILTVLFGVGTAYCGADEEGGVLGRYKVESISFDFVGKRTFKDSRLLPLLSFKKGGYVDVIVADFGREDVEKFYLKEGFAFAEVSFDRDKLSEGRVVYTVKEGPRVKVKKVGFEGNAAIKSSKLKQAVKTGKREWFLWPGRYSKEKITADIDKLRDVYEDRGLLDCQVSAKTDFSDDRSTVKVTFVIEEGPVYIVADVVLTGVEKIYIVAEGVGEQLLLDKIRLEAGQPYRKHTAESDRKRLLGLFRESGFINAGVALSFERVLVPSAAGQGGRFEANGRVRVEFKVFEGEQFRIGRVDITGNKETQDKVIRRVLDEYEFQPGRAYNAEVARGDGSGELEKKIRRMAYTEEATITALPGSEEGQKNVEVRVKEGRTGMWIVGAGVGSDSGVIGQLVLDQRNFDISDWPDSFGEFIKGDAFKGAGQRLKIALQPGTEVSEYLVSFNEPYFRGKPVSQDVVGSSWGRGRESYEEGRLKGYLGFSERYDRRYRGQWRKSIGFRVENVGVDDLDFDAPKEIRDVDGDNLLVGVRLGIGKDFTDDIFFPTTGQSYELSYEQVGGEHTFGLLNATYKRYYTVYEDLAERRTVLATGLRAGTVVGDAPPFEMFYAGGMHSIRGFEYRGVSTRGLQTNVAEPERKDPVGSDWLFLANTELTVPLVGETLSGLFFVDSGTVDSGSYRVSGGGGIQILVPQWFGPVPMRFGLAVPFLKDEEDETEAFFFSFGGLF